YSPLIFCPAICSDDDSSAKRTGAAIKKKNRNGKIPRPHPAAAMQDRGGWSVSFRVPFGEQPLRLQSDTGFSLRLWHIARVVTQHFIIAIISSGHPNTDIKCCTARSGCGYARLSGRFAPKWA